MAGASQQGSATVLQSAQLVGNSSYVRVFESIFIEHTSQHLVFYIPVQRIAEGNFMFPEAMFCFLVVPIRELCFQL